MSDNEPKPLTREEVISWKSAQLALEMKKGQNRIDEINRVLSGDAEVPPAPPEPTPEEVAAQAEDARVEAERVAAEQKAAEIKAAEEKAETDRLAAEAARPKKIVIDYQVKDEHGQPIGKPTHLEALTPEEMYEKMQMAHVNAVRYAERVKRQKLSFKKEEPPKPKITEEAVTQAYDDLATSKEPEVIKTAHKTIIAAEVEKQTETERIAAEIAKENARQAEESNIFMGNHLHDFKKCKANAVILSEYLNENNMEWTADNLEIAFIAKQDELAPVDAEPVGSQSEQPVPVVTPAPAPVVQPAPAPEPITPPAPPVVAEPVKVTPRPGVNTGLVPGQSVSGPKPSAQPVELQGQELLKAVKIMPAPELAKKMHDPKFVERLNAATLANRKAGRVSGIPYQQKI